MQRTRLRTYAPMRRQSAKVRSQGPDFRAVYRLVDQRSEGMKYQIAGESLWPITIGAILGLVIASAVLWLVR